MGLKCGFREKTQALSIMKYSFVRKSWLLDIIDELGTCAIHAPSLRSVGQDGIRRNVKSGYSRESRYLHIEGT